MVQEPDPAEAFVMASPVLKPSLVGHEREQQRRGAIFDHDHIVGGAAGITHAIFVRSSVTG